MVRYLTLSLIMLTNPLAAQSPALSVELNAAEDTGGACRLSFLAINTLGPDLSALVLEAVILDQKGKVNRLTLLDFQDLPQGRKRVRQFDLAGLACVDLGQVIVNAAATCTGAELAPGICMNALHVTSRVPEMEISG